MGPEVVEDWYITMIDLYIQERPVFALPLMERMPDLAVMAEATQDMQPTLIDERNLRMRDRLLPILEKGEAFVAVGAMHLSGENGLVELLGRADIPSRAPIEGTERSPVLEQSGVSVRAIAR